MGKRMVLARRRHRGFARDGFALCARADDPNVGERGILDGSLAATEGADPDYARTWQAGADLVAAIEDPGVDVEREDVVEAIENYRELFESLVAERAPP
jgi:hypothetical protein